MKRPLALASFLLACSKQDNPEPPSAKPVEEVRLGNVAEDGAGVAVKYRRRQEGSRDSDVALGPFGDLARGAEVVAK